MQTLEVFEHRLTAYEGKVNRLEDDAIGALIAFSALTHSPCRSRSSTRPSIHSGSGRLATQTPGTSSSGPDCFHRLDVGAVN